MSEPSVHANAAGWPGDWQGVVSVVELEEGGKIDRTEIARCHHRHRLSRSARDCAMGLGKQAVVRAAVTAEVNRRQGR